MDLRVNPLSPPVVDVASPVSQPTHSQPISRDTPEVADQTGSVVRQGLQEMQIQESRIHAAMLQTKLQDQIIRDNILPKPFFISKKQVDTIIRMTGLTKEQLLEKIIPIARQFARPPISKYLVAAAALGKSGNMYVGVNLEFFLCPLNQAVHGEQFLITNARQHGEEELEAIAISAAPCGHCRQFMNEMGEKSEFQILTPNNPPDRLASLLPRSFGPQNLDVSKTRLLTPCPDPRQLQQAKSLEEAAKLALDMSYAPYSQSPSAVAIKTKDGKIYAGSYLENVAFNPSLSPLQAALVSLVVDMQAYSDISEVLLLEKPLKVSQEWATKEVLHRIAPEAKFQLQAVS